MTPPVRELPPDRANSVRMAGVLLFLLLAALLPALAAQARSYDLVIAGGRVIDPETGLNAVRHIGIDADRITALSRTPLKGRSTIDARGLVVAPGFIDQHSHGRTLDEARLQALDGVTTALELEAGTYDVGKWYRQRQAKWPIHFGVSSGHVPARQALLGARDGLYGASSENLTRRLAAAMLRGLKQGSLGFGFMANEAPGATAAELETLFSVAARRHCLVYYHPRSFDLAGNEEAIRWTQTHGGHLQIVHVNSSSLRNLPLLLRRIDEARGGGIDVTGEVYPYTAGSTGIESAIFDEGWQVRLGGISYQDLEWPVTNERLTKERFEALRKQGGPVVIHMMTEENVSRAIAHPSIMIASDAVPYEAGGGHPRSAGTFARLLGRYVRDLRILTLPEAIAKITYLPARRLELVAPSMRRKGRLGVGADADITIIDPARIQDRATFLAPDRPSAGIQHVLVAGRLVVSDGRLRADATPGLPIYGRWKQRR